MRELMKADIFFFVTTIVVILVSIGVIVALYYIVRILRNVHDVTERVDEGTQALGEDLSAVRTTLKSQGFAWKHVLAFLGKHARWFPGKPRPSRRSSGKEEKIGGV